MMLKHVGIKPEYEVEKVFYTKTRYQFTEYLPDGSYRLWSWKTLKGGCDRVIKDTKINKEGLIYCPHCNEWASMKNFIDLLGDSDE